jgi:hypothetical protein
MRWLWWLLVGVVAVALWLLIVWFEHCRNGPRGAGTATGWAEPSLISVRTGQNHRVLS